MKTFLFLIAITLFSCDNSKPDTTPEPTTTAEALFDFNQVEHWELSEVKERQIRSGSFSEVLDGKSPLTLNDQSFFQELSAYYTKREIADTDVAKLQQIFTAKPGDNIVKRGCIPAYRDILLLKKDAQLVGVVKVCFECLQLRITGAPHHKFGTREDYKRLFSVLKQRRDVGI